MELLHAQQHKLNFPFHTHGTFNITLVLEQPFSTKLTDRFLHAPAGTIVITNPDEVHASFCDTRIGSTFFTFYISPEVLNQNRKVFFDNKVIDDKPLFQKLFKQTIAVDEKELLAALDELINKYAADEAAHYPESKLFQQFLKEEGVEKFSLEKTASNFGLDKYKFLRLFKHQTGLTPNNYIILKRIEKSKELLRSEDDLLQIAIQTGFYDATHLCKHFKKITGITPQAYRQAFSW